VLSVKTETKTILFAFTPGQLLPVHTAPVEVLLVALEGSAEITVEEKKYIFTTGQVMAISAKVPHSVRALSTFKMLLIK
jgi:quercetin dioxygenase-like cupin family protein